MKLLAEIRNEDFGLPNESDVKYVLREVARSIIFREDGKIPILHVSKLNYHKLPGGGVDPGEKVKDALHREIMEETGCVIEVQQEVGMIIEYKDKQKEMQKSYCYISKLREDTGKVDFTKGEIAKGFKLMWMTVDEALSAMEKDVPTTYMGNFIVKRDITFLKAAQELLKK